MRTALCCEWHQWHSEFQAICCEDMGDCSFNAPNANGMQAGITRLVGTRETRQGCHTGVRSGKIDLHGFLVGFRVQDFEPGGEGKAFATAAWQGRHAMLFGM